MPDKKSDEATDKTQAAKNAWIVQILVPIISVIGTIVAAYFGYISIVAPYRLSLAATQTAEARVTSTYTPSPTPSPTDFVISPTATPSPIPPPTFTPTVPAGGVKYCVDIAALNVRNGPGMDYDIVGALYQDECLYFDGQFLYGETYFWVSISPNQAGFIQLARGWVYGGALRPQDFERLPAATPPPLPYHSPTPGF